MSISNQVINNFNQAVKHFEDQRFEESLALLHKVLNTNAHWAHAWHFQGVVCSHAGKLTEALPGLSKAIDMDSKNAKYWHYRGLVYWGLADYRQALADFQKTLELESKNAYYWSSLGETFEKLHYLDEAIFAYRNACQLADAKYGYFLQWATALTNSGRVFEVKEVLWAVCRKWPENYVGYWNLSLNELLLGHYAEGWSLYNRRMEAPGLVDRQPQLRLAFGSNKPLWDGQVDLFQKTIFVYCEQGYGDNIQFLRYVPELKKIGAKVILGVPDTVIPLVWNMSVDAILIAGEPIPSFDYHCPIVSTIRGFVKAVSDIKGTPYITVPPEKTKKWEAKFNKHHRRLRVGLVWQGREKQPEQPELDTLHQQRNVGFELFAGLKIPEVDFFSLQLGMNGPESLNLEEQRARFWPQSNFYDWTSDIEDFADTAALITQLDLVIAVDTSVVHLAGSLGVPVWMLNRFNTCWRWLLHQVETPWYDAMTIYHQPSSGDWRSVMAEVAKDLKTFYLHYRQGTPCPKVLPGAVNLLQQRAQVYLVRANQNKARGWHHDALALYDLALDIDPNLSAAWNNKGNTLTDLKKYAEAIDCHTKNIQMDPKNPSSYANRSACWIATGRWQEALQDNLKAVELEPYFCDAWSNIGISLQGLGRMDDALAYFELATRLKPANSPDEHISNTLWNRAVALLTKENYTLGWQEHEWRWYLPKSIEARKLWSPDKHWLGQTSLAGKTLVVYAEQGLGDSIMFLRYVPYLKQLGATKVWLLIQKPLIELVNQFSGTDGVYEYPTLPSNLKFDFQCALLSLPLALTQYVPHIPSLVPYLKTPEKYKKKWKLKKQSLAKLRIGLVWEGGSASEANVHRNIPFEPFMQCFHGLPLEFHSLQKGQPAEGMAETHQLRHHWQLHHHQLGCMADTAALIETLDLIVSVDTSVAHLAGALNKPVWLLNRFDTCWRWLSESRTSLWYPSMEIFRQPSAGDWLPVLESVRARLQELAVKKPDAPFMTGA
ncbi:MAG: hypothetical protein QM520_00405 [Gammaproteobacteria bacterium]|nr:hypothetical protein [Gammaproteobacteria bacterium]